MKFAFVVCLFSVVLLFVLQQASPVAETPKDEAQQQQIHLPVEKASIKTKEGKTHEFDVEIAKSPVDLQMGLMFRKHMEPNHGMMFQMSKVPLKTSFWMKNTYIPLDLIFIAADGRIVNIHRNATPHSLESIPSVEPCTGVIEINGGRSDELGIKVGDTVVHPYFDAVKEE